MRSPERPTHDPETIAMVPTRPGDCGLALTLLIPVAGSLGADSPLADAAEEGDRPRAR